MQKDAAMTYRCFDVDIADRVAHVRLNRPDELNTMTPDFWRELRPVRRTRRKPTRASTYDDVH